MNKNQLKRLQMSLRRFDINICKGCESLYSDAPNSDSFNCKMAPEYDGRQCPCVDCLVKMRCRVEECEEFQSYRGDMSLEYCRVKKE